MDGINQGDIHMRPITKFLASALALSSMIIATAAEAECWTPEAAEAAQVRDLETMLMVASLRCRTSGDDFITDYNGFVIAGRASLTQANDQLRRHFASLGGLNAYDSYVTGIANKYGAGSDGLSCRDMKSIVSAASSAGGSLPALVRLAQSAQVEPRLPGGRCPTDVAVAH